MEKGEIVFRARYTKMKLFGGPIAHKVIEGYIEQNICFTRIEKEVAKYQYESGVNDQVQ